MRRVDTVVLERWELRWVGPAAWSDWVLVPPDERRLLAARIPGLPEGPELEVEVEPPAVPAVPDPRPWPEVVATIDAGVLSAIADGVEVLRARQGPDDRLELVRGAATEDQLARLWSAARRSG